jgi:hypothetical protein
MANDHRSSNAALTQCIGRLDALPHVGGAGSFVARSTGVRLQLLQRFFDRFLQLRIMTADDLLRRVLDVDVRRDASFSTGPLAVAREEAAARSDG